MVNASQDQIIIHTQNDFACMRRAGKLAAETLDFITPYVKIGVTTEEINNRCHDFIVKEGAIPAPLNYKGYPKSICTSKNAVVCHGIPDNKPLKNGDILNIDVTVILDGWHGDTSRMFWVGDISIKARRLCEITYNCLMLAIQQVKPGNKINQIGLCIEKYIQPYGYSIVQDYCGHGLGRVFHSPPSIVHFYEEDNELIFEEGMFFTIEPMINTGKADTILSKHDHWTVTTRDLSLSAQFEHSLGVTSTGVEIFTSSLKGFNSPPYLIS